MSIALALQTTPSVRLRHLRYATAAFVLALCAAFWLGYFAAFSPLWRALPAAGCATLALIWLWRSERVQCAYQIAISASGQIRLAPGRRGLPQQFAPAQVAQLLAGSTLWPGLLALRLQTEDGVIHQVVLLRDSLDAAGFRALSLALRWIISRTPGSRLR